MKRAMTRRTRNFHVPLPEDVYDRLRAESRRRETPATHMVREAVEVWLDAAEREALHQDIAGYAAGMSGTYADLDEDLMEASLEHLEEEEAES